MSSLKNNHPIIVMVYFTIVISITMFSLNPIIVAISCVSGMALCLTLIGKTAMLKSLRFSVPFLIIISITNPLFVGSGATVLFFVNDRAFSYEALIYGLTSGTMLTAVLYWFRCFNVIMTADKFLYLFGKITPKLSVIITLAIRLIPDFNKRYREIEEGQKGIGMYSYEGNIDKIVAKIGVFGILIANSLENSVITADSMLARGYGLKGRSTYSDYYWKSADTVLAMLMPVLTFFVVYALIAGKGNFNFYPYLQKISGNITEILFYIATAIIMFTGIFYEIKERCVWKHYWDKI